MIYSPGRPQPPSPAQEESPIPILGIGVACAAGNSLDAVRETRSGHRPPRIETESVETARGAVAMPIYRADVEDLGPDLPKRQLRRMSHFARLALFTAFAARRDAGWDAWPDPARVGIVLGTGHGPIRVSCEFQDSFVDGGDKCASPTGFANSVHNAPASQISIAMGLQGPCQTVTTLEQTTAGVLMTAQDWLRHGEVDCVLACVGDEYCPMTGYAYALAAGEACALAPPIQPLDLTSCTSLPGEGVVAFLLGRPGHKAKYGALCAVQLGAGERETARQRDTMRCLRAVLLAADGRRPIGPAYGAAVPAGTPVAAHAGVYGSLVVGGGFEMLFGCLALADRRLVPVPDPGGVSDAGWAVVRAPLELGPGDKIGCLQCGENGYQSLIVLEAPGGVRTSSSDTAGAGAP